MPPRRTHRKSLNIPGCAHELTFSCYRGYPFLSRPRTCRWLAEAINSAREELDLAIWAYVFMPDHVHLIIHPRRHRYDIGMILSRIKRPVARRAIKFLEANAPHWLPLVTRRRGRRIERLFWQSGGGYDRNVEDDRTLWRMIAYIHANPVLRGLVLADIDWYWSSARWFEGLGMGPVVLDPIE